MSRVVDGTSDVEHDARMFAERAAARARLGSATLIGASLLAASILTVAPAHAQETHIVAIEDGAFSPAEISIEVGDTITWRNDDDATHTATSETNWDSGDLAAGESFSFTFTRAGTYDYECLHHPEMRGTVIVGAEATPSPSPSPEPSRIPSGALAAPEPAPQPVSVLGLGLLLTALVVAAGLAIKRT